MSEGPFAVTLEGAEELERAWNDATAHLDQNAQFVALYAAEGAVQAMQKRHPYTDRTGTLSGTMHAEREGDTVLDGDRAHVAQAVVPADYASYVNNGTSRSRAFPFLPRGEQAAQRIGEREMDDACDQFAREVRRG